MKSKSVSESDDVEVNGGVCDQRSRSENFSRNKYGRRSVESSPVVLRRRRMVRTSSLDGLASELLVAPTNSFLTGKLLIALCSSFTGKLISNTFLASFY